MRFPVQSPVEVLRSNYEVSFEEWIDQLAEAESGNDPELKILDTNRKYSYGCLQFQLSTFRQYSREYSLFKDSAVNLRKEIYNCESQRKLAALMIRDDYENWRHWRNTVKKIGKPPRI